MKTINGLDDLRSLAGEHLGFSEWHVITQEQVNLFADATEDHQWIHVDPERAKSGPFGGPIAHGFLTLSLSLYLMTEIVQYEGFDMMINYGLDRVRFPSTVPVGSRVRAALTIDKVDDLPGAVQVSQTVTIEVEGAAKPSCVAVILGRYYVGEKG